MCDGGLRPKVAYVDVRVVVIACGTALKPYIYIFFCFAQAATDYYFTGVLHSKFDRRRSPSKA